SRRVAAEVGIPLNPATDGPVASLEEARAFAEAAGYPVMVKAVAGGGGRGMRIVRSPEELEQAIARARSEAHAAFGDSHLIMENYIRRPQHIEVQVLADGHGNAVHLFERDCSIHRRHQKSVEGAPALSLSDDLRQAMCEAAVKLMLHTGYSGAA